MNILDIAQASVKRIRGDQNGFTRMMTFTKKDGSASVNVSGMHSKIHMVTDTDGNTLNTKKPYVSVVESALNDLGYTTRNSDNECFMKDDRVLVKDSTGLSCKYIITEVFPDETLGLIVCFLRDIE